MKAGNFLMVLLITIFLVSGDCFAMKFFQLVNIGSMGYPPAAGITFSNAISNSGNVVGIFQNDKMYDSGIAQFATGDDAIYVHYGSHQHPYFGDKNKNNTIQIKVGLYGEIIFQIKSDSKIKFYILKNMEAMAGFINYVCLGKREDGKFVKYFETNDVLKQYFGTIIPRKGHYIEKISCNNDTIIVEYMQWEDYGKAKGEFRFKWNDDAQWFGVEQVVH